MTEPSTPVDGAPEAAENADYQQSERAASIAFEREFLGRWTEPARCEVKSVQSGERCPEVGVYTLDTGGEKVGVVCERCLPTWLNLLTKRGRTVLVARIDSQAGRSELPGEPS